VQREVGRKMSALNEAVLEALGHHLLDRAKLLVAQTSGRKAKCNRAKLYSWHAQAVERIPTGKSRNPYEFGVKVGLVTTLEGNLIMGARSFPGNPYDGHPTHEQIEQSTILTQSLGVEPELVYADLGCRGVDKGNTTIEIKHRGKRQAAHRRGAQTIKRRQAI
jgi:IS5 family transposase